ncbi:MAG: 4'-phosphopantetheinyl transferase superfamily protein [Oscillospiraceae bacterium]|nr:4'-phosphopantetheinyl transferase superfamily protein [Oscillospiraceae bacterium]
MIKRCIANINNFSEGELENEYKLSDENYKHKLLTYKSDKKKRQSLSARLILRNAISEIYGKCDYEISYTENGKPILPFCKFSLSHSEDFAACVISDKDIGIDIEKVRTVKKGSNLHFLTAEEIEFLKSSKDYSASFIYLWTRKESLLKCSNISSKELSLISVLEDTDNFIFKTENYQNYIISVCELI